MRIILTLIAMCSCLHAAESSPGKAAIAYLQQLREGTVNLEPDTATAISPHILESKRLKIASRLKRLGESLGAGELKVHREEIKGDLAGVIIESTHGFDLSQMQVIALAMIRREGQWLPAPVPASFENCGISYLPEVRKQAKALETWMLRSMVNDLIRLRSASIERMRAEIRKHLDRETLQKMDQRQILDRFLDACRRRNPHEIMAMVGGLNENLPDNWALRASSITSASEDVMTSSPWRLLMSKNVLRVTVDMDDEFGPLHTSIACLDPMSNMQSDSKQPAIALLHLKLFETPDGLWQVDMPEEFWQDQAIDAFVPHEQLDRDLLDRFASAVRKQYPAQAMNQADEASKALIQALQHEPFTGLIQFMEIPDQPEAGRHSIIRAAQVWGSLRNALDRHTPRSAYAMLALATETIDSEAAILAQTFSSRKPDGYNADALFIKRLDQGWLWNPKPSEETMAAFKDWFDHAHEQQKDNWQQHLFLESPVITKLDRPAPDKEHAKAIVERWIEATESGDIITALSLCALTDADDSQKRALLSLKYDIGSALNTAGKRSVEHVLHNGPWAGVGTSALTLNTNALRPEKPMYQFYPIIDTEKGAKILIEIELLASTNKGRPIVNNVNLDRANKLAKDARESLSEIFEQHKRKSISED